MNALKLSTAQVRALKNLRQINADGRGFALPKGPQSVPYVRLATLGLIEQRSSTNFPPDGLWMTDAGRAEIERVLG